VEDLYSQKSAEEIRGDLIWRFQNGFFNTRFTEKVLYDENYNIETMDELRALMTISKDYLEHIYQKHCRNPNWSPKEEDMNKALNTVKSYF
jgi:hypothetical protein